MEDKQTRVPLEASRRPALARGGQRMGADLLRGQQASGAAPAKRVQAARRRIYGRARPSVHGDNERRRREEAGAARGGGGRARGRKPGEGSAPARKELLAGRLGRWRGGARRFVDEREGSAREEAAKMGVREGERAREREYVSGKLRWQAARDGQTWLPAFTGWRRRKLAEDFRRSVGSWVLAPFLL